MKRNVLSLLFCFVILSCCKQNVTILKGRGYEVIGQVTNCEGCAVNLQLYDYNLYKTVEQTPIRVDTVKNNQFNIAGRITRPGFYEIKIKDWNTGLSATAKIYLPAREVKIIADMNGLPPGEVQRFDAKLNAHSNSNSFNKIVVSSSSPIQDEITQYVLLEDSLVLEYLRKKKRLWKIFGLLTIPKIQT